MSRIINSYTAKERNKKATLKRLLGYLYAHPLHLFGAVALAVGSNVLALLGPYLSGKAIDAMRFPSPSGAGTFVNFPVVIRYVALMAIFYLVAALTGLVLSRTMIALSRKIVFRMRKELFDKLTVLPVYYFDVHQAGDLVSRITYDIDTINTSLSVDAVQLFTSVFSMIGSVIMMLSISAPLMLVFCITIPLSILFTGRMSRISRPRFRERSAKLGEMNGYVEEIVSAGGVIKAYHQEEVILSRFDIRNQDAGNATYRAERVASVMGPGMNAVNNLSLALISILGSILYVMKSISIGGISSFILYSRKFAGPINELANISAELQSALSAAERVFKVLDEQPEAPDAANAEELYDESETDSPRGDVRFEQVDFGYEEGKLIIEKLNMHVKAGQTAAIVGSTGAGKTTVINLLMRFYDANGGAIYIDGKDITKVTRASLRSAFTMVLQDTWLFGGTVYDNIAYGRPEATREEVVEAAKIAGIHSFITRLRDGYDTVVDEAGINISKGQKQLLTIARAILKNSSILILDEATSNVDTQTEMKIQRAIRRLMTGKTAFVIAHRLSTVKHADIIFVFEHGRIIESGTHEELLEKNGAYADMYNSQFS